MAIGAWALLAPALALANEGLVVYDGLRLLDMEGSRVTLDQASGESHFPLYGGEASARASVSFAQAYWRRDYMAFMKAKWSLSQIEGAYQDSLYRLSYKASASIGPESWGTGLSLNYRGYGLKGSWLSLSPFSFVGHDTELPDTSGEVSGGWSSRLMRLQASRRLDLGHWTLEGQAGLWHTFDTPLETGHQLRDSSHALWGGLDASYEDQDFTYEGSLHSGSAFVYAQGLRLDSAKDTKRFAMLRSGMDAILSRHSLSFGSWWFRATGAWIHGQVYPTNNWRNGETLAANRLFPGGLWGILAQSFYRRSYELQGDASLWLPMLEGRWARPWPKPWGGPSAEWLLACPLLRADFQLVERTDALLFSTGRDLRLGGRAQLLLSRLQAGWSLPLQERTTLRLTASQWMPLWWKNSLDLERLNLDGDSLAAPSGPGEAGQSAQSPRLLRDGFSLGVSLRGAF